MPSDIKIVAADRDFRPAELRTAFFDSPFGHALIAVEPESNCIVWLSLVLDNSKKNQKSNLKELKGHWRPAGIKEGIGDALSKSPGKWIFESGARIPNLLMKGTEFQHSVWNQLVKIRPGETCSYADVAKKLNRPKTHARAVATAVAANTVAVLVPCHRVVRSGGAISGYRWGTTRKQMLLDWETSGSPNKVR